MREPGPELDKAVAEALGFTNPLIIHGKCLTEARRHVFAEEDTEETCEGPIACHPFCPSTDANDALWAAEKAGLWGRRDGIAQVEAGLWEAIEVVPPNGTARFFAGGKTIPHAICLAILELKGA